MPQYLIGEELNTDPVFSPRRYVIYLSDVQTEEELVAWPELRDIVTRLVKPERMLLGSNPNNTPLKHKWWAYQAHRPALYAALRGQKQTLCLSRVGQTLGFSFVPTGIIFSEAVVVFVMGSFDGFALLQGRVHELWARTFASSMKDDLRYTPSDCFETFPFPMNWKASPCLEATGYAYYNHRAALMKDLWIGLTDTYNLFHAPDHEALECLRKLYAKREEVNGDQRTANSGDWRTVDGDRPLADDDFLQAADTPVTYGTHTPGRSPFTAHRSPPPDRSPFTVCGRQSESVVKVAV